MKLNLIKKVSLALFIPALTIAQAQTKLTKHIAAKSIINSKQDGTIISSKIKETLPSSVLRIIYDRLSPMNPSASFTDNYLLFTKTCGNYANSKCCLSILSCINSRISFDLSASKNTA